MLNLQEGNFFAKKGNPRVKVCQICGKMFPMTRRAARDWEKIQFCSAVCRRNRRLRPRSAEAS